MWFPSDGDEVVFNTDRDKVNARSLARDGRFALCVVVEDPYAFATLGGRAVLIEGWAHVRGGRDDLFAAFEGGPPREG